METQEKIIERYENITIKKIGDGNFIYVIEGDMHNFEYAVNQILCDDHIEEVMYNGEHQPVRIFHHTYGMCNTNLFYPEQSVRPFIFKVVILNNKTINETNPIVDGVLEDGSRVNIIIPPASLMVSVTIRKFKHITLTVLDLIKDNTLNSEIAAFLWTCISRLGNPANILIIGGTASGKTTVLNALSMFIRQNERVLVIEDTPELQLKQPNIVRMISNEEMNIDMNMLLKNALRMRPDRIIIGEVRGEEALTLFSAMNTGHEGCLGTLHANSAKESVSRITNPPMNVPINMMAALHLIVVLEKMPHGERHVLEICEISGVDSKNVRFNKIFEWDAVKNQCVSTEIPSRFKAKLAHESGKNISEIDSLVNQRKKILDELITKNAGPEELLTAINNF